VVAAQTPSAALLSTPVAAAACATWAGRRMAWMRISEQPQPKKK
jgi:hypothetical protein